MVLSAKADKDSFLSLITKLQSQFTFCILHSAKYPALHQVPSNELVLRMTQTKAKILCTSISSLPPAPPPPQIILKLKFLSQAIFVFCFFGYMVVYANEVETKENKNYLR